MSESCNDRDGHRHRSAWRPAWAGTDRRVRMRPHLPPWLDSRLRAKELSWAVSARGVGHIRVETGLGHPAEQLGHEILEHGGVERVDLVLTAPLDAHQIRQLQNREVMRQSRGAQGG